jgi:8-oxo-dGTP diphosphatase
LAETRFRWAAYGVCQVNDRILLARYVSQDGAQRHWTLPGGGIEHGEDPFDAVGREVEEETGYQVDVEELLGVSSRVLEADWGRAGGVELHSVGIYYRIRITGGELRSEDSGTTDLAAWIPVADVAELERTVVIDFGLQFHHDRPPSGHVAPIVVSGLLRD